MNKEELFNNLTIGLENKLHFLEDKPEETIESTVRALWFAAAGIPKSAVESLKLPIPELTGSQIETLNLLLEKRIANIPLSHITGRQNFMGIELLSDRRALIPRKETEILGNKALDIANKIIGTKQRANVIDVCCGAGNLAIAIAHYNPRSFISAADLSGEAVALARDNVSFLKLDKQIRVFEGDVFSAFEKDEFYENIDLIVCNPPYISSTTVQKMNVEIAANEPVLAFDGGMLGTKIIQKLIREAPRFLVPSGWVAFEVGLGQGPFIMQLCERTELYNEIESASDNSGNIRVIAARRKD
jgi:release factor glutamine methyltransferase